MLEFLNRLLKRRKTTFLNGYTFQYEHTTNRFMGLPKQKSHNMGKNPHIPGSSTLIFHSVSQFDKTVNPYEVLLLDLLSIDVNNTKVILGYLNI